MKRNIQKLSERMDAWFHHFQDSLGNQKGNSCVIFFKGKSGIKVVAHFHPTTTCVDKSVVVGIKRLAFSRGRECTKHYWDQL